MKSISMILLVSSVILLFLVSCAPANRTRVVLIPDPDGKVGEIFINNESGSQIISEAGQMSEIRDATTPPGPPSPVMTEQEINRIFGDALATLPERPLTLIIYFKTNSTELNESSLKILDSVRTAIDSRQSQDISVIGHTDRVGTDEQNYILSRNRALKVKKILVMKGVNPDYIEINYHGEANPLVKTEEGVAEPRNRRVEVTIR